MFIDRNAKRTPRRFGGAEGSGVVKLYLILLRSLSRASFEARLSKYISPHSRRISFICSCLIEATRGNYCASTR